MAYGVNAPFGLMAVSSNNGSVGSQKSSNYRIAASSDGLITFNQNIFAGDPVITNPTLKINAVDIGKGAIAPYIPVDDATTNPPLGVFQGCSYIDINGQKKSSNKWIANTPIYPGSTIIATVNDDPNQLYSVQVSSSDPNIITANFNTQKLYLNANFGLTNGGPWQEVPAGLSPALNPGSGNLQSGISGFYLNGDTIDTTITLPFKILSIDTQTQNTNNLIYPINPTTGLYDPANNTGTAGGFFINVIGKFNVHAQGSTGTLGKIAE